MRMKATKAGTFPAGCHWSQGKEREINVPDGSEVPTWLVEVKVVKPKAKAKKAKPEPPTDGG